MSKGKTHQIKSDKKTARNATATSSGRMIDFSTVATSATIQSSDSGISDPHTPRGGVGLIRLLDSPQANDPRAATLSLISSGYQEFFIRVPDGFGVAMRSQHSNAEATARNPLVFQSHRLNKFSYIQLPVHHVQEIISNEFTAADTFYGKALRARNDSKGFDIYPIDSCRLLPVDEAIANSVSPHRVENGYLNVFKFNNERFVPSTIYVLTGISLKDMYIYVAAAQAGGCFAKAAENHEPGIDDPYDFENLCPAIFKMMCLAKTRYESDQDKDDATIEGELRRDHPGTSSKRTYGSPLGGQKRAQFASRITRATFKPSASGSWRKALESDFASETFVVKPYYSPILRLVLIMTMRWVRSSRTDHELIAILNAGGFQRRHVDDHLGMISHLIAGRPVAHQTSDEG